LLAAIFNSSRKRPDVDCAPAGAGNERRFQY
jgi:hypothetical protein